MTRPGEPDLRVFEDTAAVSRAGAGFLRHHVGGAVSLRGVCSLVLSGGATPRPLYTLLAEPPYRDTLPWSRMHIFWSDERCVPPDHPESNYKMAFDTLLSRVPLPKYQVHRIPGEEGPDRAAELYEKELFAFGGGRRPVFDLVLLGVGEDGHTASLFPGSVLLQERNRLALPVHLEAPRLNRVTLSLPLLNDACHVVFLAAGRSKAGVVHEIMEDGNPKAYPAGMVKPGQGGLTWIIDSEAASALVHGYKRTERRREQNEEEIEDENAGKRGGILECRERAGEEDSGHSMP